MFDQQFLTTGIYNSSVVGKQITNDLINISYSNELKELSGNLQINKKLCKKTRKHEQLMNIQCLTNKQLSQIICNQIVNHKKSLSQIEETILKSTIPVEINELEEITVNGQNGIWANKTEVSDWKGIIPLENYTINDDLNPEIINKRTQQDLTYIQEIAIRYLKPPTPKNVGEILIKQESNIVIPPAPPLVIRQQPARPSTPEPLIIREAPPKQPIYAGQKVITISGKRLPPPPRKVIIERLAPLPPKPQSIMIERWLPYKETKRRVIFQKANKPDPIIYKPKNIIIQWEAPHVTIKKDIKYLGIIRANPAEYVQKYGASLKNSRELPKFVLEINQPNDLVLAADYKYNEVHELEGDISALNFINLEKEGLSEYKSQVSKNSNTKVGYLLNDVKIDAINKSHSFGLASVAISVDNLKSNYNNNLIDINNFSDDFAFKTSISNSKYFTEERKELDNLILKKNSNRTLKDRLLLSELFTQANATNINTRILIEEAETLFFGLAQYLERKFTKQDFWGIIKCCWLNSDNTVHLDEFRFAFEKLL